jgi:hypothetical protein
MRSRVFFGGWNSLFLGTLGWLCVPLLGRGADAQTLGVLKGQALVQFTASAPVPEPGFSYRFIAFVEPTTTGGVTNATVQALPGGAVRPLLAMDEELRLEEAFSSLNSLNTAFPSASYRLAVGTLHDGQRQLTLPVLGSTYPNDPHVANFDAAQAIDPTREFTLRWDPFIGAAAADFIQVSIEDSRGDAVFRTPGVGQPGALTGAATSVTIPANKLPPGRWLTSRLRFSKLTSQDTQSYPGALGLAGFFKETVFAVVTVGVPDTQAPVLVSSSPVNGATGVPRTAVIAFTFNEPMLPLQSVAWSPNLDGRRVGYAWNEDQRTLFCIYDGLLPAGATISWTLNPAGKPPVFRDPSGNVLATVSGGFTTTGSTTAPDVEAFGVQKGQRFEQKDTGAPALQSGTPYGFAAFVALSSAGALKSATVALPNATTNTLPAAAGEWKFERTFASLSDLSAHYPNGTYTLALEAMRDGPFASALNLAGDLYPNPPRLLNLAAAQAVDADQDFRLQWEPFAGGSINDFVQLRVTGAGGTVFETAVRHDDPAGLDGRSTAVTIPANTLLMSRTYRATLRFVKAVTLDFITYPGVIGVAGYFRQTEFTVKTTGPTTADVAEYALAKQQTFVQSPLGVPVLEPGTAFEFSATVTPSASGGVSSAAVRTPTGASRTLSYSAAQDTFSFREAAASSAALETAYPAGTYTLTVGTAHDGLKTLPLVVPASAYPTTPSVLDLPNLQKIDASKAVILTWTPFLGAGTHDGTRLAIFDSLDRVVFRPTGADPGGLLPPSQRAVLVPAGTLEAGQTYRGELSFVHRATLDLTTYPVARGVAAFHTRTRFDLATVPGGGPPRLEMLSRTFEGKFQFRLVGEPNRLYSIEVSTTLKPGEWLQLLVVPAAGGSFIFVDDQSLLLPRRFYRARVAD